MYWLIGRSIHDWANITEAHSWCIDYNEVASYNIINSDRTKRNTQFSLEVLKKKITVLFPEGIQWLFKSVVRFCRVTRGISHDMFWVYLNPAKFYHFFLYLHLSLLPLSCCSLLCLHKCTLTGSRSDQFSSSVTRTSLDFPAFISKDMKIL